MDKSPNPSDRPAAPETPPAELLLRAIRSAAAMAPGRLLAAGEPGWAPPVVRRRVPASHRYGTGLHAHPFPEVCIVLEGRAAMEVAGRVYRLDPPTVAVIDPGAEHSELFLVSKASYRLLWLGMRDDSLLALFSWHRGGRRWQVERISPLQGPAASRLRDVCSQKIDAPMGVDRLRGELLAVLSELYRYEVMGRAREQGGTTSRRLEEQVDRARAFIDSQFNQPLDVAVVAELTALSPNYLNTLFSKRVGMGVKAYLIKRRMDHAMELCSRTDKMMKQIALAVGYEDPLYFSRVFHAFHGVTPSEARRQAQAARRAAGRG